MAFVQLNISSYDTFKSQVLGNGYDVDGYYGYQCWDLGAELWGSTGNYPYPYLQTGPQGYVLEAWTVSKAVNLGNDFDAIYSINDVKRGDMLIFGPGGGGYFGVTGHNTFADEDYNGSGWINGMGQNQENASPVFGHVTTINRMPVDSFLGAFRYKGWSGGPTPPTPTSRKYRKKFPWYIYNNRFSSTRYRNVV